MMSHSDNESHRICNYYVDEAGDGTLFNKRGKVIIGTEGCSHYFIIGFLDIPNPQDLSLKIKALHDELLADPYFKNIPSMQPQNRKTALALHAKDDIPEVRREVFKFLVSYKELKFSAVVKSKKAVLQNVQKRQQADASYRYRPDDLYDLLIERMFKNRLGKADEYRICFAKRGHSDRTKALEKALNSLKRHHAPKMMLDMSASAEKHCLQAADYFLWALQRFYEKREDRYIQYLWPRFQQVIDIDDTRKKNMACTIHKKSRL